MSAKQVSSAKKASAASPAAKAKTAELRQEAKAIATAKASPVAVKAEKKPSAAPAATLKPANQQARAVQQNTAQTESKADIVIRASTPATPTRIKETADSSAVFKMVLGSPQQTMEKIMSQTKSQMDKMTQEAANASRESVEAYIKSGSIFFKGVEEIVKAAVALSQSTTEKQTQFIKEALSSKTLNEWTEVQNKIAQTSFDDFMSGVTKISEMGVKVLTDSAEPVNAQMSKAIKKASESMAA